MLPFPISVGRAHPSVGAADFQSALNPCTFSAGSFRTFPAGFPRIVRHQESGVKTVLPP